MPDPTPPPGPVKQGCPCLQGDYLILSVDRIVDLINQAAGSPSWLTIITCVVTSVAACLAAPSQAEVYRIINEMKAKQPK